MSDQTSSEDDKPANNKSKTRAPKKLTPHTLRIIRMLASGHTYDDVVEKVGTSKGYIYRLMGTKMARAEYDRINAQVAEAAIEQIASSQTGTTAQRATQLTQELDDSVLESIQMLRQIMTTSKSDTAKARAAQELLDLAQAKQRLALLDKGLQDGTELSSDDIHLLHDTLHDLKHLHEVALRGIGRREYLKQLELDREEQEEAQPSELTEAGASTGGLNDVPGGTKGPSDSPSSNNTTSDAPKGEPSPSAPSDDDMDASSRESEPFAPAQGTEGTKLEDILPDGQSEDK